MTQLIMPKIDKKILSNKETIVKKLKEITNSSNVLSHKSELIPYETDALTAYRQIPLVVVLPETTNEVSKILKYCNNEKIKIVPRGAGRS